MHEMAIAQSILRIVLSSAQQNDATKVKTVRIRAGELRGIVQSQLSFLFEFVTKDTIAEGAALDVEVVPIKVKCKSCEHVFTVVGPICESGDVLGHDRVLPPSREGDVLLIANAGAYGRVMSSHYNLRAPAEELTR